jgi:hypothetical protein
MDRGQLTRLGVPGAGIDYRVKLGRLQVIHRGVYGLGPLQSKLSSWMAAVLAAGPEAVLSHRSAAQLWGLIEGFTSPVDVTLPRSRRGRPGIRFHRSSIPDDERTVLEGIPVTTVPRTTLDCAAGMSPRRIERLINQADVLRLHDRLSLPHLLTRYPRRSGSRALLQALHQRNGGPTVTKSELEERFLELVDELGLPRPESNVLLELHGETLEVDALWRAERVAVELDGRQFHDTPLAFERDRRRDRRLIAARWQPVRITWRQLEEESDAVARDLTMMLAADAA